MARRINGNILICVSDEGEGLKKHFTEGLGMRSSVRELKSSAPNLIF